ncbi:MAG: transcription antitermination factor NusB [bacterium]|nr:transcription antitermination factor NusB [bacterium]MBU1916961.1 transcription antitermination factor NusB [bacterium]
MGIRRKAREMALKAAFEIDFSGSTCDDVIENIASNQKLEDDVMSFMQELLEDLKIHSADIDKIVEKHSNNWKLSRMASVDRNILRLGVLEIMYKPDIPKNVTINEYLEIAKKYGTEDSSSFINGILDKINKAD